MNCARWDLCGGYRVTGIPTANLCPKRKKCCGASRMIVNCQIGYHALENVFMFEFVEF